MMVGHTYTERKINTTPPGYSHDMMSDFL